MENTSSIIPSVQIFQMTIYIPTFIFGLLFNLLALWMIFFRIRKWTEATTYVTTLIMFDSLLLLTLPFKMRAYKMGTEWNLGSTFCIFLESLYFINMYGSILISVCICMDRYIAIQYPFHSVNLRSPKRAALVCCLVCIIVCGVPSGFLYQMKATNKGTQCFYGFSIEMWMNVPLIVIPEVVFVCSAIMITFCTAHITFTLKKKTNLDPATPLGNKSMKILLANLFSFLFSFAPFHLSLLLYFLVQNGILPNDTNGPLRVFLQLSLCLANINCCLDSLCYYFVFKDSLRS
ncbi:hypothetical protein GDO86_010291 [Hymenochirus boettgeri]|uniref:G-protein coupled receptors family 1 profile domain-containing protein n=1 Tax=Hymenochirus boettgeri TaxID=247094 RepID=A0A8T2JMD4_9PIPI|nr:hypothetical protein GDO86_010291 [Hymenochirus boettgeri]